MYSFGRRASGIDCLSILLFCIVKHSLSLSDLTYRLVGNNTGDWRSCGPRLEQMPQRMTRTFFHRDTRRAKPTVAESHHQAELAVDLGEHSFAIFPLSVLTTAIVP